jgi:Cytochrome b5-like Heme/Steroid binding domain
MQDGSAPPPLVEGEEPPPHPVDGTPLANVWIYGGEAYDLTEFIMKHPGGEFFIGRSKNRDITAIVNIFHRNPERVKKVLKKYSLGRLGKPEDIHPKCNAPAFLFNNNFNSWEHTPKYNFDKSDDLITRVRKRLNKPDMSKRVAQVDAWFDQISVAMMFAYVLVQVLRLEFTAYMPIYLFR